MHTYILCILYCGLIPKTNLYFMPNIVKQWFLYFTNITLCTYKTQLKYIIMSYIVHIKKFPYYKYEFFVVVDRILKTWN